MTMQISTRELVQYVRELGDFKDAHQSGKPVGERRPLAEKLAERIPGELIPSLRQLYLDMVATSVEWQQSAFQAALSDAVVNKKLLAGFPPTVWISWGVLMLALLDFLDIPQDSLDGMTAKGALLDDYIPLTDAQWMALNPPAPVVTVPEVTPEVVVPEEIIPEETFVEEVISEEVAGTSDIIFVPTAGLLSGDVK